MCRHEQSMLVGGLDGITCRACGSKFTTWEALTASREAATAQEAPGAGNPTPAPKPVTEAYETPKRGRPKKNKITL